MSTFFLFLLFSSSSSPLPLHCFIQIIKGGLIPPSPPCGSVPAGALYSFYETPLVHVFRRGFFCLLINLRVQRMWIVVDNNISWQSYDYQISKKIIQQILLNLLIDSSVYFQLTIIIPCPRLDRACSCFSWFYCGSVQLMMHGQLYVLVD